MTRVVHVVAAGEIGGAERLLVDLATRPAASRASHAVALLTPSDALARLLRDAGLRVHDRGPVREDPLAFLVGALGPFDAAWIERVLREERADVAHLHTFASQVTGTRAALRAGARVVRTEHSTRVYVDPSCWPFSRWSLRRAHAVVAISEHVRRVALAKAPWAERKTRTIYNGIDVARFAPRPRVADAAHFRFVLVGRLEPRKGVDLAIDALASVPDAQLDVVGDGEIRPRLEAHARDRGVAARVTFHGHVADTRPIVAHADAGLCSSREEGLGNAVMETMAMARAVVSFPVGGVPESVKDGDTGLLARDGTAASLADAMRAAMNDRPRLGAMGARARAFVVAERSIDAMCAAYGDVYAELAR